MDFSDPFNRFLIIAGAGILVLVFFIFRANAGKGETRRAAPDARPETPPKTTQQPNAPSQQRPYQQQKPYNKGGQKPYNKDRQGGGGKKPYNKGGGQQGGKNYKKKY